LLKSRRLNPIYSCLDANLKGADMGLREMSPGEINDQLDQEASLRLLRAAMTLEDVAEEVKSASGQRPAIATLSRLENGKRVRPVFGLRETEIGWTFYTTSGIARDAQLTELDLRVIKWNGGDIESAIIRAENTVINLARRLELLQRSPVHDSIEEGERRFDRAALDSLRQQIRLYRWGLLGGDKTDERKRLMTDALQFAKRVLAADKLLSGEMSGQIISSRAAVNGFFSTYVLDVVERSGEDLPQSHEWARRYGTAPMFLAAFRCAAATRDPRLAHHFAELAVLLPHDAQKRHDATQLKAEHPSVDPVVTSACLLVMSKRLDRQEQTPIRAWKPRWREAQIPHLEEALRLVEQAERLPSQSARQIEGESNA
jgi:hypothetical protein